MFGNKQDTSATHPGELGPVGRAWEMAKHVFSKAAKYGAVGMGLGALVGAPVAMGMTLPAMVTGGLSAVAGWFGFGSAATTWGLGAIGMMATPILVPALAVGAALAVIGAVAGMAGANKAANDAEEDRMAIYDRAMVAQQRGQAMDMRQAQMRMAMMQQAQTPGISSPNMGLPGGRGGRDMGAV